MDEGLGLSRSRVALPLLCGHLGDAPRRFPLQGVGHAALCCLEQASRLEGPG